MGDWFEIRIKTEASQFNAVRSKILGWPEEVARDVYWPQIQAIGDEGIELIRHIILDSETPTGQRRAARGGNGPGRVDTGTMFDKVGKRVRERKNGFSMFVGWVDGRPGYAIFQELGTDKGVKGMNAIQQAQDYMLSRLQGLAKGRYIGSAPGFNEDGE